MDPAPPSRLARQRRRIDLHKQLDNSRLSLTDSEENKLRALIDDDDDQKVKLADTTVGILDDWLARDQAQFHARKRETLEALEEDLSKLERGRGAASSARCRAASWATSEDAPRVSQSIAFLASHLWMRTQSTILSEIQNFLKCTVGTRLSAAGEGRVRHRAPPRETRQLLCFGTMGRTAPGRDRDVECDNTSHDFPRRECCLPSGLDMSFGSATSSLCFIKQTANLRTNLPERAVTRCQTKIPRLEPQQRCGHPKLEIGNLELTN